MHKAPREGARGAFFIGVNGNIAQYPISAALGGIFI